MAKRRSKQQKASVVAASLEGVASNEEIARKARVPISTLYEWKRQAKNNPELTELVDQKRVALAEKMRLLAEGIADKLIGQVDQASFDNKAATVMGIAADKYALFSGQPTQITESRAINVNLTLDARAAISQYQAAGFSAEEALEALSEDDPDLYRAYVGAEQG